MRISFVEVALSITMVQTVVVDAPVGFVTPVPTVRATGYRPDGGPAPGPFSVAYDAADNGSSGSTDRGTTQDPWRSAGSPIRAGGAIRLGLGLNWRRQAEGNGCGGDRR
jgi:hypothetical protein